MTDDDETKDARLQAEYRAADQRDKERAALHERAEKRIAGALLDLLAEKDLQVLKWICELQGKTPGRVAHEMLRTSLAQNRKAFREAHGGGGSSSTNQQALMDRLG